MIVTITLGMLMMYSAVVLWWGVTPTLAVAMPAVLGGVAVRLARPVGAPAKGAWRSRLAQVGRTMAAVAEDPGGE